MTELFPKASKGPAFIAYTDGASRGNPGPAGYGVVIRDENGNTLDTISEPLGMATNNVAEYSAMLAALRYAVDRRISALTIRCDSELMARQMQGRYRVQSPDLKPLFEQAKRLASQIEQFVIQHIPREQNSDADRLANEALDRKKPISGALPAKASGPRESGQLEFGRSSAPAAPRRSSLSFLAVAESGLLRPLQPAPPLEEGAEYEVQLTKRSS